MKDYPEICTTIAGIAFLPVLPKPDDYPLMKEVKHCVLEMLFY